MKNTLILSLVGLLWLPMGCTTGATDPESKEMTEEQLIKRGEYLVTIMDCNVCHSPKMMTDKGPVTDPNRMLSGHPNDSPLDLSGFDFNKTPLGPWIIGAGDLTAWAGPWGISYAANLTPDPTGIGNFTLENFKLAFQKGKYHGGENARQLMPPMPWESFAHLPPEDVNAIYTYLQKGVRPVNNVPPAYAPPAGSPPVAAVGAGG